MTNRTFKAVDRHGAEMEFELQIPNLSHEHEGERQYRIAYSKALAAGIFPRNKLKEVMREHGMWTEEDESAMRSVVTDLAVLQVELEDAQMKGRDEECLRIAKEMSGKRNRMWELFMIQQSVYMNSAEGVAEMVKTESIMAACTVLKANQSRYWKNYSEFVTERDEHPNATVFAEAMSVQNELLLEVRDQLEDEQPENRYLKDVQSRILDRDIEEEVQAELSRRAKKALDDESLDATDSQSQTGD
jgi:hypothetical protein